MAIKKYEADDITIKIDLDKCVGAGECVDVKIACMFGKSCTKNV